MKRYDARKVAAGLRRQAHYAAKGTPRQWRGSASITTNKKKQANKRACRSKQ
jgi:hypothetical protein